MFFIPIDLMWLFRGHAYERKSKREGDILALNPGTAHGFGVEVAIALLETDSLDKLLF